jgi:hypothetical protein
MRRRRSALLAIAFAAAVAAGGGYLASALSGSSPVGSVVGMTTYWGGPAVHNHGVWFSPTSISVRNARDEVVGTGFSHHGRFSFALQPGHYSLVVTARPGMTPRPFVVRPNETLRVNLVAAGID